jgi:molybdopterin-guanine dinucleotide biosynthesis protein A
VSDEPLGDLGAVIVCGGRSSRMGRSKALLPFGDELLLQRVINRIAPAAHPIVVVAAPEQELPPLGDDIIIARDPIEGLGPLQGIAVGLEAIAEQTRFAFVSSTDAPFVSASFVRRMRELCEMYDAAVPHIDGFAQPLSAVYHTNLFRTARQLLDAGVRRPRALFDEICCHTVRREDLLEADPELWSLRNVNTPEDYAAALRDAGIAK